MLTVPVTVGPSEIHGLGVKTLVPIKRGQDVWVHHPLDQRIPVEFIKFLPAHVGEKIWHYGYVNPERRDHVVLCFDDARFMNFAPLGTPANTYIPAPSIEGYEEGIDSEPPLLASRDIEAGEELTVPFYSDADAYRKMYGLPPPSSI